YGNEILQTLMDLESEMKPDPYYIDKQIQMDWSHRSTLIEWIAEVHQRLHLVPEMLFLCANCIDRFLSCKTINIERLQLVGITALFIAAKYEEVRPPPITDMIYWADDSCTDTELKSAEHMMLSKLEFQLGRPSPIDFFAWIGQTGGYSPKAHAVTQYFLEVTIIDACFLNHPPSLIAGGAYALARIML
ncbi:cyclin-like protein, partial [Sparassis latifolia]